MQTSWAWRRETAATLLHSRLAAAKRRQPGLARLLWLIPSEGRRRGRLGGLRGARKSRARRDQVVVPTFIDRPPVGWHASYVTKADDSGNGDWVALLIDVPVDQLKYCRSRIARDCTSIRVSTDRTQAALRARQAFVRVPGKHRSKDAAWAALEDLLATRH